MPDNEGGRRAGSGRKNGVLDKKTQNLQRVIADGGPTPLDQLIEAMRFFRASAAREQAKGEGADVKLVLNLIERGAVVARYAAPYVHQRLAVLEITHRPMDLSKLTEAELGELERLIAAADGNAPSGSGGAEETHH